MKNIHAALVPQSKDAHTTDRKEERRNLTEKQFAELRQTAERGFKWVVVAWSN